MNKLNAKQLRISKPTEKELKKIRRLPIYLVLDGIIDTYNTGSLFRLADAIAAEKIYLCGDMEYPPSIKIHRAAVGTENWVPWEKTDSTLGTVEKLKKQGVQITAIEQHKRSTDYRNLNPEIIKFPLAIVCGNESRGLPKKVIDISDLLIELPMMGINKSFNVWGSTAVAAYKVLEFYKKD